MMQSVFLAGAIVLSASLVVLGCLAIFFGMIRRRSPHDAGLTDNSADAAFIFRDKNLIDSSDRGQILLMTLETKDTAAAKDPQWAALMGYLTQHFPGIEAEIAKLPRTGQFRLSAAGNTPLQLCASYRNDMTRLCLTDMSDDAALLAVDRSGYDALQKELLALRFVNHNMPSLAWRENADGDVIWANSAYLKTLHDHQGDGVILSWPLPAVFDRMDPSAQARLTLERAGRTKWFSHIAVKVDDSTLHFATPIDAAVQSDAARQQILQTLTHTFSDLHIGLALFDAERRLQVFNPVLVDLTGLEPLFLATRPSLAQVLYSLRDARMLPEPEHSRSWREEIQKIENAAQNGTYDEQWLLGNGNTYLFTGRPQPDGGIALIVQDITTEASLTRSFSAEIDTLHATLDSLDQGVAVFDRNGRALLANAEYTRVWDLDPCVDLADRGLAHALAMWSDACETTVFWARLAEFVSQRPREAAMGSTRAEISGTATLRRGGELCMQARSLTDGSTMLLFNHADSASALQAHEAKLGARACEVPDLPDEVPDNAVIAAAEAAVQPRKGRVTTRHSGNRVRA